MNGKRLDLCQIMRGKPKFSIPKLETPQLNWGCEKRVRPHLKNADLSRGTSHETSVGLLETERVECVSEQGLRGHSRPRSKTQKHETFVNDA